MEEIVYTKEHTYTIFDIIEKSNYKGIKKFYKSEHSSKESTGIGLALAKTIIEKENGYIKVESKSGCGTTFEIKYVKC